MFTSALASVNSACKRSLLSKIAITCPIFTISPSLTNIFSTRLPSPDIAADNLITSPSGSILPSAVTVFISGMATTGLAGF